MAISVSRRRGFQAIVSFEFEAALCFIDCGYLVSKLLFHRIGLAETSPFDEAIVSVAKGSHIKVVSPYIGLRYFQRLVALSSGWRLVSDIEAWLSSLANHERILSTQFIQDNCERIHHFPAIHAKTVIGRATAYLGSANLTFAGIQTRTEMGVLVDERAMIADLHLWFDELWQATSMPIMAEVLAYSRGLDSESREQTPKIALKSLSFDGEQIRARLMRLSDAPSGAVKPEVVSKSPRIERNLFRDLEDEVRMLIEKLANSGFTFKEFVVHIRSGRVAFRTCAVYLELMRYCGNLPRSVFSPDTLNRLIYKNGLFRQSTASDVTTSLAQYDTFLATLTEWLSFGDAIWIQGQLEARLSIRRMWVRRWLCDLRQSGLLVEFIATTKEPLVSYQLNEKFEWTGRWRLFERARQAWDIKLKSHRGLASLPNAVTGDGERKGTETAEGPDKSVVSPESVPTPSHGLGPSVYVRTHMEKRLPPMMTTTVSSGLRTQAVPASSQGRAQSVYVRTHVEKRLPPIMATTVSSGTKTTTPRQEKASVNSIRYRADNVYFALFERLAKSEDPGVIRQAYSQLVHHLAKDSGEPADFIFQVLEGKIASLPAAAKILPFKGRCSVSALLNEVPAYPRTSVFLRSTLGKGKRKFVQPSNDQTKPKVQPPERAMLSVKSSPSTGSEQRLILHRRPEGDNAASSQVPKVDQMAGYMQRVASIFKDPSL